MKQVIKQIKQTKKDASILIAGHKNSDPDSVFSCAALYMVLTKLGYTNVTLLLEDSAQKIFNKADFLPNIKTSNNTDLNADLFCALDLPTLSRLGIFAETYKRAKHTLAIDHHPGFNLKTDACYSISEYSSTCELIFNIAKKFKALNTSLATALYIGMRSDTVNFRACITPNTLSAAAECLKYGVSEQAVYDQELRLTENEFNVFSGAYAKTKCTNGLKIVVINEDELISNNVPVEMAKVMAIELYHLIDGIKVLAVLIKHKNKITGSFRSYSSINLQKLAASLGGGGHEKACAFESTTLTEPEIIKTIKTYYKENNK